MKKTYSKPIVNKIRLEDEEVASMVTCCKTGDPTLPTASNNPIGDCEPGVGLNNLTGAITAADACMDATLSPCSGTGCS